MVEDFKDLRVYRKGFEAAMTLFDLSREWPQEEQYALTDQVRRSSRAICSNIAEAWFKRRYPKHFASKLSDAASETAETMIWIDFAVSCNYLSEEQADELASTYRHILGGLIKMSNQAERWCSPSMLREDAADYDIA